MKELSKVSLNVVTAHGRQQVFGEPSDRLVDALAKNGIPWSAVSIYGSTGNGQEVELVSGFEKTLGEFPYSELYLYFNRNVNPFQFNPLNFSVVEAFDSGSVESTEYIYQNLDNESSKVSNFLKKLTPEECRQIIADRVEETVFENIEEGATIIVGVSGGGDSNSLLHGLNEIRDRVNVVPVIIMGIPDWDKGVPRAQELCKKYDFELTVLDSNHVKDLLGIPHDSADLIDRYEREFVGDDFEFLGTLLIRLALTKYAREIGTAYIATGLNLEDVLCENMFRTTSGLKPASMPLRQIGDIQLLMPLWMCPKRIIDGCFPKLSLDNYEARYPCFSLGRNLYYSIVYSLQSQYPGYVETLAKGFSKLAKENPVEYKLDEDLGFYVERLVPLKLRTKFKRMLKGSTGNIVDTVEV